MCDISAKIKPLLFLLLVTLGMAIITSCNGGTKSSTTMPTTAVILDTADGGISNGQTNVSANPMIILQFTTSMDPSTISDKNIIVSTTKNGANPVLLTKFTANTTNTKFHFSSLNPLQANTVYYIIVKNTETANDQQSINGDFYFVTGDSSAPTVSIISPENNASGVWNTADILIKFSESVGGVNRENIHLFPGSINESAVSMDVITESMIDTNVYKITLREPMHYLTNYYLVLGSGITDSMGNNLNPTTFTFTTVRQPALFFTYYRAAQFQACFLDEYGAPVNCKSYSLPFLAGGLAYSEAESSVYITNAKYTLDGLNGSFVYQYKIARNFVVETSNSLNVYPHYNAPQNVNIIYNTLYSTVSEGLGNCQIENDQFFCANSATLIDSQSSVSIVTQIPDTQVAYVGIFNGLMYKCGIQESGALSNCAPASNTDFTSPTEIYVDDDNQVYIYDQGNFTTSFCSIDSQFNINNCVQLNKDLINGLGLFSNPLYFDKYINKLAYISASNNSFTMISYTDNHTLFGSLSSGDGSFVNNSIDDTTYAKVLY